MKHQSYPKSRILHAFEQKKDNVTALMPCNAVIGS